MNKKLSIGLVFGGRSGEHEVSIASAISVYNALDKSRYDVTLIAIDKWALLLQGALSSLSYLTCGAMPKSRNASPRSTLTRACIADIIIVRTI